MTANYFATTRYCQISADKGSSEKGWFEQMYLPFFYILKEDCFGKFSVCRKELHDPLFLV